MLNKKTSFWHYWKQIKFCAKK